MFETDLDIGAPKEPKMKTAFSLELFWSKAFWRISGDFLPRTEEHPRSEEERNLDADFELSEWLPPLATNPAPTISLLSLDKSDSAIAHESIPDYIPTEITQARLVLSSDGVELSGILASRKPPVRDDSGPPMVSMEETSLAIRVEYSRGKTSKFDFFIGGTISLPPAETVNPELYLRPTLNAAITCSNGVWGFRASANNIRVVSLLSIFGNAAEQENVRDILGHILLDELTLKDAHAEHKTSEVALDANILFRDKYRFTLSYRRGA